MLQSIVYASGGLGVLCLVLGAVLLSGRSSK
jgi:hypothetical protein